MKCLMTVVGIPDEILTTKGLFWHLFNLARAGNQDEESRWCTGPINMPTEDLERFRAYDNWGPDLGYWAEVLLDREQDCVDLHTATSRFLYRFWRYRGQWYCLYEGASAAWADHEVFPPGILLDRVVWFEATNWPRTKGAGKFAEYLISKHGHEDNKLFTRPYIGPHSPEPISVAWDRLCPRLASEALSKRLVSEEKKYLARKAKEAKEAKEREFEAKLQEEANKIIQAINPNVNI